MFCIRTQTVPRCENSELPLHKTNLLIICEVKDAVYFRSVQNTQTQCEPHVELLNFKRGGT